MILTEEKAKAISDYLVADQDRAKDLFEMSAEDAAVKMSADGCDVAADELIEFGHALAQVTGEGELSDTDLDNVAGGSVTLAVVGACAVACGVGYLVGCFDRW
jgi:hypothetical protein